MGNWRTVNLRGTVAPEDLDAVREFITPCRTTRTFHCLSATTGLAGLGMWAKPEIHADGNLAERGYDVNDVAETLRKLVQVAPSLRLKAHVGDDYESETCIATVTVEDGQIRVGPAERASVAGVDDDVARGRLFGVIFGPRDLGPSRPATEDDHTNVQ